ncbi:vegetative cell wall protein gp1-like [Portunus trituberculatus]|uniref:vegetative cell wall protein gp1-like n=1 Tax=Portunus trituberculatus TaxID=210409 RepID=UPI001E1CDBC4|nr:vegetative cell wall protein gp1-like [Portunus trituberculatus]
MCLVSPGKRGGRGQLTPLPAPASIPRLCPDPLPRHPISALSPPAVQPAPGPTEPAPPPPLAPQCSMGSHDAPASHGRPTVVHTSSSPTKQRSRDGRAPSPPPSLLQPIGGRASAPPTHLRVSASVPPRQPIPSSSDSPAPSPPPQHPEWFPASQRPLLWVRDICSGARFLVDSGAEVSVVLAAVTDRRAQPRTAYDLLAANRTPIATYGTQTRRVALLPGSRFRVGICGGGRGAGNPGDRFSRCSRPPGGSTPQMPPTRALGHYHPRGALRAADAVPHHPPPSDAVRGPPPGVSPPYIPTVRPASGPTRGTALHRDNWSPVLRSAPAAAPGTSSRCAQGV